MRIITRTIWILSLVSLFTDVASEMLYPVMPIYLKSIGFSVVLIGVLEGFAEAVAGLSKGYFGKQSDDHGRRLPFVRWGYLLSALSKPMLGLFSFPLWIFSARTLDRIGKGVRTGARDAMLSAESSAATKAQVFGFHRSMDTLGAAIGPLGALLFLYFFPERYKALFFIAAAPGFAAIVLTFLLHDKPSARKAGKSRPGFLDFLKYWKVSPPLYRRLVIGLLVFALFNSSDVFLLLSIKERGWSDTAVLGAYIFYNIIYAVAAWPMGATADRLGLKNIFLIGTFLFVIVYAVMAFADNIYLVFGLFAVYGIYAAATESVGKAWISNMADEEDTATAIGTYAALQSICSLIASSLTGVIWYRAGVIPAFLTSAVGACCVAAYIGLAMPAKALFSK